MRPLWTSLALLLASLLHVEGYTCPSGKSKETITLAVGESVDFSTQETDTYGKNVKCVVKFKRGKRSKCKLNFSCDAFTLTAKNSNCNKGSDFVKIGKEKFCEDNSPDVTVTGRTLNVLFRSNKRSKGGEGAECTATCIDNEEASTTTPAASTTLPPTTTPSPATTTAAPTTVGEWSEWQNATSCSRSCGNGGTLLQTRICQHLQLVSEDCEGKSERLVPCNTQSCPEPAEYIPGTPGAGWNDDEVATVREKLFVIMEALNWKPHSDGWLGGLKMPGGRAEGWPSENKLMRIAFHDCLKYTDGTGGCDGCLDMHNVPFKYMNFFTAGIKPQSNVKPQFYYDPERFKFSDNNDLEPAAIALEEVYTNATWPPGAPPLNISLWGTGKSRADLWAFAGLHSYLIQLLESPIPTTTTPTTTTTTPTTSQKAISREPRMVALERAIERANRACDLDFHSRQQIPLLEGRDKCDIKLTSAFKFKTGRSDCVPTDLERPYASSKPENHPLLSGTAEQTLDFLYRDFNFSARESIAILGIHSVIKHQSARNHRISGFKYLWFASPYLTSMYYKMLANKPMYFISTTRNVDEDGAFIGSESQGFKGVPNHQVAIGDAEGRPVAATKWKSACNKLWNTTDGGPCFWRPMRQDCTQDNPAALELRENCFNRTDECCKDATFSPEGIQTGGCRMHSTGFVHQSTGKQCDFNLQFAMHMEVGLYHNFSLSGPAHRATGCPGLDGWRPDHNATDAQSPPVGCGLASTAHIVEEYAADHDVWAKDFLHTFQKMQENVERPDDLYEGPQTSWLGYLSLAQRVDIADYADYIEQNKPLVFTDPDADPKVCAECHRRFSEY